MMFTPAEEKVQNPLHSRRLAEFCCGVYEKKNISSAPYGLMTLSEDAYYHPMMIRPSITRKELSSGDSQTLMDYASKCIQWQETTILKLTIPEREACFYKSLGGASPRLKSFCYQLSRRYKNVTRFVFSAPMLPVTLIYLMTVL